MFDDVFYIVSGGMVLYWICWMVGFKVPGCGTKDFHGWLYCPDDCDDEPVDDDRCRKGTTKRFTHQH